MHVLLSILLFVPLLYPLLLTLLHVRFYVFFFNKYSNSQYNKLLTSAPKMKMMMKIRPKTVLQAMSPYPTVDMVTIVK